MDAATVIHDTLKAFEALPYAEEGRTDIGAEIKAYVPPISRDWRIEEKARNGVANGSGSDWGVFSILSSQSSIIDHHPHSHVENLASLASEMMARVCFLRNVQH